MGARTGGSTTVRADRDLNQPWKARQRVLEASLIDVDVKALLAARFPTCSSLSRPGRTDPSSHPFVLLSERYAELVLAKVGQYTCIAEKSLGIRGAMLEMPRPAVQLMLDSALVALCLSAQKGLGISIVRLSYIILKRIQGGPAVPRWARKQDHITTRV